MKKRTLVAASIASAALFSTVSAQAEPTPTVLESIGWFAYADTTADSAAAHSSLTGGAFDLDASTLIDTTGKLSIDFNYGKTVIVGTESDNLDDFYPTASLVAPLIKYTSDEDTIGTALNLGSSTKITLTYTSDKDVWLILPMKNGENSLTEDNNHFYTLKAATSDTKVDITINATNFVQHSDWGTTPVTFDPSKVSDIEFSPVTEGATTKLTISAISIDGLDAALPVTPKKTAVAFNLSNVVTKVGKNSISLNVPTSGSYQISVIGANGKMIENKSVALTANSEKAISLSTSTNGVYFVKVEGNGINVTQKIAVK